MKPHTLDVKGSITISRALYVRSRKNIERKKTNKPHGKKYTGYLQKYFTRKIKTDVPYEKMLNLVCNKRKLSRS